MNEVVRPEIDRTGVYASASELTALGSIAPAACWSTLPGPMLILKPFQSRVSVTAFTIDTTRQGFAAAVATDGFEHEFNRRLRRRHACDMWRKENSRMVPERMAFGQRLVFGDVENGG
jgi:hypothetical protein